MTVSGWVGLVAMLAALIAAVFAVLNEIRRRRMVRPVWWEVEHVGSDPSEESIDIFELTNTGLDLATSVQFTVVGSQEATSFEMRPIRVVRSGESKRAPVQLVDSIDKCWVLVQWVSARDRRYCHFQWFPANDCGPLMDTWFLQYESRGTCLIVARIQRLLLRRVRPVGPSGAPYTRVRGRPDQSFVKDLEVAGRLRTDWLEERIRNRNEESSESGGP